MRHPCHYLPSFDNQKCLQTLPSVPGGQNHPKVRTTGLGLPCLGGLGRHSTQNYFSGNSVIDSLEMTYWRELIFLWTYQKSFVTYKYYSYPPAVRGMNSGCVFCVWATMDSSGAPCRWVACWLDHIQNMLRKPTVLGISRWPSQVGMTVMAMIYVRICKYLSHLNLTMKLSPFYRRGNKFGNAG